jgi:hypothetical protein
MNPTGSEFTDSLKDFVAKLVKIRKEMGKASADVKALLGKDVDEEYYETVFHHLMLLDRYRAFILFLKAETTEDPVSKEDPISKFENEYALVRAFMYIASTEEGKAELTQKEDKRLKLSKDTSLEEVFKKQQELFWGHVKNLADTLEGE